MDPVNSVTGDDTDSVDSITGEDTTKPQYWLHLRFFLCSLWVLIAIIESLVLIWRYEGFLGKSRNEPQEDVRQEKPGIVYMEDSWKTCYKSLHPGFLLAYRLIAFCVLMGLILSDVIVNSGGIFIFYTQWTFTLVTIYFALASLLSMYGCCHGSETMWNGGSDPEIGTDIPQNLRTAGFWGYTFQILYQTAAGAIILTDVVFWLIIYPFLTDKDFKLNFLLVCMHSVNAVCFLGDLILNNLKFPFFRIAYFLLWTCAFVIFQWILHSFLSREAAGLILSWTYPLSKLQSGTWASDFFICHALV